MRLFTILAVLIISLTSFSGLSCAQEETKEEKKSTLASMFSSWNEKQKEKLKAASGVLDVEKTQGGPPPKEYKPAYQARKAQGAKSRIFDPVTSWIEQRRAYQKKNLANIDTWNTQRKDYQAKNLEQEAEYNTQRDLHLKASLEMDAQLQDRRNQHLAKSLDSQATYEAQQKIYLEQYMAAHRKYLDIDANSYPP